MRVVLTGATGTIGGAVAARLQERGDNAERPRVLVSQSATGFYGPRNSQPVDESPSAGDGFLADLVVAWEAEALSAPQLVVTGQRVVLERMSLALASATPASSQRCTTC